MRMSHGQTPSYVVRQDAGGELKLLLVRDPRATNVAAKISPVKKQPPTSSQSAPLASGSLTSSSSSSSSSSAPAAQQSSVPAKIKTAVITAAAASSRGSISVLSPDSLTEAASEALLNLVKMSATQGSASAVTAAGKKGDGVRVKGGRIIKLQQSRPTPLVVPQKSSKSPRTTSQTASPHTTVSHSHTGAKPQRPGDTQSHSKVSKPVPKRATTSPKHQALLPVSRIRTIMRTNVQSTHSTHNVSQDSVALVTKATELFIAQLAKESHKVTMAAATRDVSYGHLAKSVRKMKQTTFLHDILPEKVLVSDYLASLGNHPDSTHKTPTASSSH